MATSFEIGDTTREDFRLASFPDGFENSIDLQSLQIQSGIIREGVAEWDRLRAGRAQPLRSDIDPLTLPRRLLPYILLIDVTDHDLPDFRWRLIGTHITEVMQRDSTGSDWRALYDEADFAKVSLGPRYVLETGVPCRTLTRAPTDNRQFLSIESVDLPLSTDGQRTDMIMAFSHAQVAD